MVESFIRGIVEYKCPISGKIERGRVDYWISSEIVSILRPDGSCVNVNRKDVN